MVYIIVGTVPVVFAAVQPWVWSMYAAAAFLVFLVELWRGRIPWRGINSPAFLLTGGIFFLITLLQVLPLPPGLLNLLSPFRFSLLERAGELTGSAVSWPTVSYLPFESLAWWLLLLSLALLFPFLREAVSRTEGLRILVYIVLAVASLEALYGLLQALVPSLGVLWVDYIHAGSGCARGTFINRNHFAAFMEMVWPVALGYTLALGSLAEPVHGRSRIKRMLSSDTLQRQLLLCSIIGVILLSLVFSKSRGGITGAFIGFFTFAWLVRTPERRLPLAFRLITGGVIGLVIVYGLRMGFSPIVDRFLMLQEGLSRVDLWKDALAMIRDHPLGIGLANFKEVFPVYFESGTSETTIMVYSHNDYLQTLIEAGWPGFLALVGGYFLFLVRSFIRAVKASAHAGPMRFYVGIGALSGLVSLTFHEFFDFNLKMPANAVYFVTLMAIVHGCFWERGKAGSLG